MKLGIVVVYLFDDVIEPLLHTHLQQIERTTQVPYTIYGSVNRLSPRLRSLLEAAPHVRTFELAPTALRAGEEHAYYLDRLVQIAVDDGATHIAVLHVDSFPIRPGWAEHLAGQITDGCPLVVANEQITACLFCHRDFYLQKRPKMRLSGDETDLSSFREHMAVHHPAPVFDDSGVGYAFAAHSDGLEWRSLGPTAGKPGLGTIYDDTIYHLVGATRVRAQVGGVESSRRDPRLRLAACFVAVAKWVMAHAMPRSFRTKLRKLLRTGSTSIQRGIYGLDCLARLQGQHDVIRELAENPDRFLAMLRRHAPPSL